MFDKTYDTLEVNPSKFSLVGTQKRLYTKGVFSFTKIQLHIINMRYQKQWDETSGGFKEDLSGHGPPHDLRILITTTTNCRQSYLQATLSSSVVLVLVYNACSFGSSNPVSIVFFPYLTLCSNFIQFFFCRIYHIASSLPYEVFQSMSFCNSHLLFLFFSRLCIFNFIISLVKVFWTYISPLF